MPPQCLHSPNIDVARNILLFINLPYRDSCLLQCLGQGGTSGECTHPSDINIPTLPFHIRFSKSIQTSLWNVCHAYKSRKHHWKSVKMVTILQSIMDNCCNFMFYFMLWMRVLITPLGHPYFPMNLVTSSVIINYLDGCSFQLCMSCYLFFSLGLTSYMEDCYTFSFILKPIPEGDPTPVPVLLFASWVE